MMEGVETVGETTKETEHKKEETWKQHRGPKTKAKRWTDQDNNPCVAEANASYSCLHDSNFDRKSCQTFFVNYQNCQKFWLKVTKDRMRRGIKPTLPPLEERNRILQETG